MPHYHAAVWLDHKTAKVFFFGRGAFEASDVSSVTAHAHLNHDRRRKAARHAEASQAYYHDIVEMLRPAHEWVLMGPGSAKNELATHIETHDREYMPRVIGVATVDHPTDNQIVAQARAFFKRADRMRPA